MVIRISLGTKFHFKQTFLKSGTILAQKGYLQSKTEKVLSPLNTAY